jgi:hypothetical protein
MIGSKAHLYETQCMRTPAAIDCFLVQCLSIGSGVLGDHYCSDMNIRMEEMYRVMKPTSKEQIKVKGYLEKEERVT